MSVAVLIVRVYAVIVGGAIHIAGLGDATTLVAGAGVAAELGLVDGNGQQMNFQKAQKKSSQRSMSMGESVQ